MTNFHHLSVFPQAADYLVKDVDGIYVDCTLGGGGHSGRIAARLSANGRLIGIDRDAAAIEAAKSHLADLHLKCRVDVVRDNFANLTQILNELSLGETSSIDGIIFDLGVSSHQIDTAERGFSYINDAPLDMRMDERQGLSAFQVINEWPVAELKRIFYDYGEERWAGRIAEFIEERRQSKPIETTGELVDVIERAIPKAVRRKLNGHPAKRVFQAVRIAVNGELEILQGALQAAVKALKPGGEIAVITFHSLEDRIVKETFQALAKGCVCPPDFPVCVCGHRPEIKIIGKVLAPSEEETAANPRAKSAKLRRAEKLIIDNE